jgi:hypothetical protein
MQALMVVVVSVLASQPVSTPQVASVFAPAPLSDAELASATAAGNDTANAIASRTTTGLSLDVSGRTPLLSISRLISNTDAQSVAQGAASVDFRVALQVH